MMEARRDFRIEVNVFDSVFYFADGAGTDRPAVEPERAHADFGTTYSNFLDRAWFRPTFLRNAAYAVMNHLDEVDWSGIRHTILIRDPHYSLPSHRHFVADITMEEAGYTAQRALFRHLRSRGSVLPVVLDAHDLLRQPAVLFAAWCSTVGIDYRPDALHWNVGFRDRWRMWSHWKEAASKSTGFLPFRPRPEVMREGAADPLFDTCWACYQELYAHRLGAVDGDLESSSARHHKAAP